MKENGRQNRDRTSEVYICKLLLIIPGNKIEALNTGGKCILWT